MQAIALAAPPTPTPLQQPAVQATPTPPAISGGTLLVTRDGAAIVASDPDRDRVYVVDPATASVRATLMLTSGDEPGRLVEDAAGRVHVVLRAGGAVATLDVATGEWLERRAVCDVPRGLAYDAALDALHVACAEGVLVSLPAAGGEPSRVLALDSDLRDVIVQGDSLLVSRFRSAELLRVDAGGSIVERRVPASGVRSEVAQELDGCGSFSLEHRRADFTPAVAWRVQALPDGSVAMLHQRAQATEVPLRSGGYGGGMCDSGIVQSVLTLGVDRTDRASRLYPTLMSQTMAVDLAVAPGGSWIALATPGLYGTGHYTVLLYEPDVLETGAQDADQLSAWVDATVAAARAQADAGTAALSGGLGPLGENCVNATLGVEAAGQVTAVAFVTESRLAVQTREPARLLLYDLQASDPMFGPVVMVGAPIEVVLATDSRQDTGHDLFHLRAGGGIACASCHAEGGDDGHVWNFDELGPRRTQHLRGGLLGTEPLHWGGDMASFADLAQEVFVGRMGGFAPQVEQIAAAARWIHLQPAFARAVSDPDAVMRGRALFESEAVGCTGCHAGAQLTNNKTVDVGTGGELQVPSLLGVAFRAPYMHDGCAPTLRDRFGACGGGDQHGKTSQLDEAQIQDLIAYLESL